MVSGLKDANAEIAQIEAGLKSRTQAIAERGYDAEQVDAEIAREPDRERKLGLGFRRPGSPAQLFTLFALGNLFLVRKRLMA